MNARALAAVMVMVSAGCAGDAQWNQRAVRGGGGEVEDAGAVEADAGAAEPDAGAGPDGGEVVGIDAGAAVDAGATDGGGGGVDAGVVPDPCTVPIPTTCHGRSVVFREWGPNAVGDGTYFASQAPQRLGFNRMQGFLYLVRFRVEANTYWARVSAYGDATEGAEWISNQPCGPSFAVDHSLWTWGVHGGGNLDFIVTRNEADAQTLKNDPAYAAYRQSPQVRGGTCYFAAFENTGGIPTMPYAAWLQNTPDTCMDIYGNPGCYYLAFDMSHELRTPTGGLIPSHVIPGLTQP
jgi:hypothetical protein